MLQSQEYLTAFPPSLESFFQPGVAAALRKVSAIPILAPLDFDYDCLYVEAVEEIFTELTGKAEQSGILLNLIATIINCLLNNKPIYLDLQNLPLSQFVSLLHHHLPTIEIPDNLLSTMATWKVNDFTHFLSICAQRDLTTIKIGGVYGKACVWYAAIKLAHNIYALKNGDFHPNVRILSQETKWELPFQTAIIDPKITEYYYNLFIDPAEIKWYKFPGTISMSPKLAYEKALAFNPKKCLPLHIRDFLSFIKEEQKEDSPEESILKKEVSLIPT